MWCYSIEKVQDRGIVARLYAALFCYLFVWRVYGEKVSYGTLLFVNIREFPANMGICVKSMS